jgi:hypothetical protein
MSDPKAGVRQILDRVKADKRSSLTAPDGKLVCEAYGIPVPREAVAKSAGDAESGLQDKVSSWRGGALSAAPLRCPVRHLEP